MNIVVWAQMQSLEVLERVDEICPGISDAIEEDLRKLSNSQPTYDELRRTMKTTRGRGKVAAGITLVAIGMAGILDPTKAWQARKIQLAFALAGAYIGGMFGNPAVGFGIGSVVGGIVAAVYLYGMPVLTVASGVYLIVEGLFEMV